MEYTFIGRIVEMHYDMRWSWNIEQSRRLYVNSLKGKEARYDTFGLSRVGAMEGK
jgi:hypothetical protein